MRLQAGIPTVPMKQDRHRAANGLLIRGLVTATYEIDSTEHPQAPIDGADRSNPVAVYCDVLVYPSVAGQRWYGLKNVLVTQDITGLHRGRIWKPRAASLDITGGELNIDQGTVPANTDGDHVLIGFMHDNLSQPIILRALPHPNMDVGREDLDIGQRMRLKSTDGDPDFFRHHGIHYGVTDAGNFIVDSTYANAGLLDTVGKEPDPPTSGTTGTQQHHLPQEASYEIVLYDMTKPTPEDPPVKTEVMRTQISKDQFNVSIEQGATLLMQNKDGDATATLGDGAVSVAIANTLATLWASMKSIFDAHVHQYIQPLHPSPTPGYTVTPSDDIGAPKEVPSWDANIESQKLTIPDN